MASEALALGVIGLGTGLLQGFNAQFEADMEEQARRRQSEYLRELDERMRKSREKEERDKVLSAFDAYHDFEAANGPLEPPDGTVVPSRSLRETINTNAFQRLRPLLEAGLSPAQFQRKFQTEVAADLEQAQNKRNAFLLKSASQLREGASGDAAANFAHASRYSQDGISTAYDPQTGLLTDIDEETRQPIGAAYELTPDRLAQSIMTYDNFISRQDKLQAQAIDDARQRERLELSRQQAEIRRQDKLQAQAIDDARQQERLELARQQAEERTFLQSARELASASGLDSLVDQINTIDEMAAMGELPEEIAERRNELAREARIAQGVTALAQAAIPMNREDFSARSAIANVVGDLVAARREIELGVEAPKRSDRLQINRDIQIDDAVRVTDGARKVFINGREVWLPPELIRIMVKDLPHAEI